ncbi:MAG: hypothetical protein ACFFAV_15650 [Candidatus Hermodarchaeota archaeon]
MSKEEIICENCGENTSGEIYECVDCFNPVCDECANICKKCGEYLCDGCYQDHKKNCKK